MPETGQTLSVFVSVDMEGVAGITTQRQCTRGTDDYAWARRLMTQEASAAAAGAVDAGYLHVTVSDSHGDMGNILPHEMDSRAELVQGGPKTPWSMMTGLDDSFMCAAFVGYHAGAGTARGVLDHTITGWFADVRVNGEPWNETRLNAALAGTFGVPIVFVAGDEACCEQAKEWLPWVRTVATKRAFGSRSARSLSPARSQAAIRGILREALRNVEQAEVLKPEGPYTLELQVTDTAVADRLEVTPGTERTRPRTVTYASEDFRMTYRMLMTWSTLARTVKPD